MDIHIQCLFIDAGDPRKSPGRGPGVSSVVHADRGGDRSAALEALRDATS